MGQQESHGSGPTSPAPPGAPRTVSEGGDHQAHPQTPGPEPSGSTSSVGGGATSRTGSTSGGRRRMDKLFKRAQSTLEARLRGRERSSSPGTPKTLKKDRRKGSSAQSSKETSPQNSPGPPYHSDWKDIPAAALRVEDMGYPGGSSGVESSGGESVFLNTSHDDARLSGRSGSSNDGGSYRQSNDRLSGHSQASGLQSGPAEGAQVGQGSKGDLTGVSADHSGKFDNDKENVTVRTEIKSGEQNLNSEMPGKGLVASLYNAQKSSPKALSSQMAAEKRPEELQSHLAPMVTMSDLGLSPIEERSDMLSGSSSKGSVKPQPGINFTNDIIKSTIPTDNIIFRHVPEPEPQKSSSRKRGAPNAYSEQKTNAAKAPHEGTTQPVINGTSKNMSNQKNSQAFVEDVRLGSYMGAEFKDKGRASQEKTPTENGREKSTQPPSDRNFSVAFNRQTSIGAYYQQGANMPASERGLPGTCTYPGGTAASPESDESNTAPSTKDSTESSHEPAETSPDDFSPMVSGQQYKFLAPPMSASSSAISSPTEGNFTDAASMVMTDVSPLESPYISASETHTEVASPSSQGSFLMDESDYKHTFLTGRMSVSVIEGRGDPTEDASSSLKQKSSSLDHLDRTSSTSSLHKPVQAKYTVNTSRHLSSSSPGDPTPRHRHYSHSPGRDTSSTPTPSPSVKRKKGTGSDQNISSTDDGEEGVDSSGTLMTHSMDSGLEASTTLPGENDAMGATPSDSFITNIREARFDFARQIRMLDANFLAGESSTDQESEGEEVFRQKQAAASEGEEAQHRTDR